MWDRVSDDFGDMVESNVVDAKPPNLIVDVEDILLMWYRSKKGRAKPFAVKDLTNLIDLLQLVNHRLHNFALPRAKVDGLRSNRRRSTSIDIALIIEYRNTHSFRAEDAPLAFDKGYDLVLVVDAEVSNA